MDVKKPNCGCNDTKSKQNHYSTNTFDTQIMVRGGVPTELFFFLSF